MRPSYESQKDLDNESILIEKLKSKWDCYNWIKSDKYGVFDYWVSDKQDRLVAVAEIKTRKCKSTDFPSFMISKKKFDNVRWWADIAGKDINPNEKGNIKKLAPVFALFFIQYTDTIKYYKYSLETYQQHLKDNLITIKIGGRTTQQRDKWDIEEVVYLESKLLTQI